MNRSNRASLVLLPLLFVTAPAFAQTAPAPAAPPAEATPAPAPAPAPMQAPAPAPAPAPSGGGYDAVPAATPAPAPSSSGGGVGLTTLKILKDKGIISQAEYDSAVRDMGESVGAANAGTGNTVVAGKWATTLYGFVEADSIFDTTQSFNDLEGNGQVARGGTYAGSNNRMQFGLRNTRLGFRFKAPEVAGIRSSATIESDFLGNQLAIGGGAAQPGTGTATEGQYFTNPAFRMRHAYLKVETPVVDLLIGQYWDLYGWQQVYAPNTVELQGVPGQLYSRTPQIRISKSIKSDSFLFEIAAAALRPVQRDSAIPKGQAGIRIGTPAWSGLVTNGGTGTSIQPLSIAVTGDARVVTLPFPTDPGNASHAGQKVGTSIAVDAFIPVIPKKKREGNALSLTGEFSTGYGNADMYTGLTGGAPAASYAVGKPAVTTYADIDPGIAMYDSTGAIHLVQWTSYIMGIQYYLPGTDGKFWFTANYSNIGSNNLKNNFAKPATGRDNLTWYDICAFWDATDAVRFGLEGAMFQDKYIDGTTQQNGRVQFSAWYIF